MIGQAIDAEQALLLMHWQEMLDSHIAAVLHNVSAQAAIAVARRELEEYNRREDERGRRLGDPGYDWEWTNAIVGLARANYALAPRLDNRVLSGEEVADLIQRLS